MGKFVSVDSVIQIINDRHTNTNPDNYNLKTKSGYGQWMHSNGEACAEADILDKVRQLHPEQVIPVVHGDWKRNYAIYNGFPRFICSNCGFGYGRIGFYFCPNCGAKMDGDDNG